MIRTESEYQRTLEQLEEGKSYVEKQRNHFQERGLEGSSLERALHPTLSFYEQLKEDVEIYESIKRGDFGTLRTLNNIGHWLIGARIAKGWSQKELAERLEVSEAQVSRDERNEYHGIKVERAQRILETMDFHFRMEEELELNSLSESSSDMTTKHEITMPPPVNVPEQVSLYLRADPKLDEKKAKNLEEIFRLAYETAANNDDGGS